MGLYRAVCHRLLCWRQFLGEPVGRGGGGRDACSWSEAMPSIDDLRGAEAAWRSRKLTHRSEMACRATTRRRLPGGGGLFTRSKGSPPFSSFHLGAFLWEVQCGRSIQTPASIMQRRNFANIGWTDLKPPTVNPFCDPIPQARGHISGRNCPLPVTAQCSIPARVPPPPTYRDGAPLHCDTQDTPHPGG